MSLFAKCLHTRSPFVLEAALSVLQPVHSVVGTDVFCDALLDALLALLRQSSDSVRLQLAAQLTWLKDIISSSCFMERVLPSIDSLLRENDVALS